MRTASSTSSTSPPRPEPSTSAVCGCKPAERARRAGLTAVASFQDLALRSRRAASRPCVTVSTTPVVVAQIEPGVRPGEFGEPLAAAAAGRACAACVSAITAISAILPPPPMIIVAERRGLGAPAFRDRTRLSMLAAGEDPAVLGADRRADREFRIGRIGLGHRRAGGLEQIVRHRISVPSHRARRRPAAGSPCR